MIVQIAKMNTVLHSHHADSHSLNVHTNSSTVIHVFSYECIICNFHLRVTYCIIQPGLCETQYVCLSFSSYILYFINSV